MGLTDRIASGLNGLASTISRVASALRNPSIAPEANLPEVPHWTTGLPYQSERLRKALLGADAYLGKVSTDAGPSWTRFSSYPATDLTPEKIIGAQQEAIAGYPLRWAEMIEQVLSRDGHLSGIGQQRVDDVIKGTWQLERATNDDVAACVRGFCQEALYGIDGFDDDMAWLLWSNAYCYNAGEIIWAYDSITFPGPRGERIGPVDVVVPRMLENVHPKHFRFDLRTDEPLLWLGSEQVQLPFGKFVFLPGEGQHPIIERHGYMWPCVWYSLFKSIGWASWIARVDRFDMPIPIIEYDADAMQYQEYQAAYTDILNRLGKGLGVVMPRDRGTLRIENPPSGGQAHDPQSAVVDASESAQSVRVLGATLTAKIGNVGSFAASTAHLEVKYAREEADARRLWNVGLRPQLLRPLVYFNAANLARAIAEAGYADATPETVCRRIPRGQHRVPREMDPKTAIDIVDVAVNRLGLPVSREAMYGRFNLPQPLGAGDVLAGAPQPVTSGGKVVGSTEAANEGVEAPKEPKQLTP